MKPRNFSSLLWTEDFSLFGNCIGKGKEFFVYDHRKRMAYLSDSRAGKDTCSRTETETFILRTSKD